MISLNFLHPKLFKGKEMYPPILNLITLLYFFNFIWIIYSVWQKARFQFFSESLSAFPIPVVFLSIHIQYFILHHFKVLDKIVVMVSKIPR